MLKVLYKRGQRGAALIAALLVLVIFFMIAAAFTTMMVSDVKNTNRAGESYVTFYAAEAGLEYAKWLIKHNMSLYPRTVTQVTNYASGTTETIAPGSFYALPLAQVSDFSLSREQEVASGADASNSNRYAKEHIFVSDLSFPESGGNFLSSKRYCSTFQIRQSGVLSNSSELEIVISSTGKLRSVPDNWDWLDQSNLITLQNSDFDKLNPPWTLVASRTITQSINIEDLQIKNGVVPAPPPFKDDITVWDQWREFFR